MKVLRLANEDRGGVRRTITYIWWIFIRSFWGTGFTAGMVAKALPREDPYHWYFHNIEDPNPRGYDAIRRLFLLEMIRCLCRGG